MKSSLKENWSDPEERTRDLFEHIAGYEQPPLAALPDPKDWEFLESLGLQKHWLARSMVSCAMTITGFRRFQKTLPQHIESLLRRVNLRGPALFSPVISASLALQADGRKLNAIERACTLIFAANSLRLDLAAARFPADQHHGHPLDMGEYPNLFATHLIVDHGRARVFKSRRTSQITVLVGNRMYLLEVGELGVDTSYQQLKTALEELVAQAAQQGKEAETNSLGWLSAASDRIQLSGFRQLEVDPSNAMGLAALRHSLFTVCLDLNDSPESYAQAATLAHSRNYANRWFHASLQLVIFGNAQACTICSFSAYLDGNTMIRSTAEIQARAASWPIEHSPDSESGKLIGVQSLSWQIPPRLIEQAQKEIQPLLDDQPASFEIEGIGRTQFDAKGVPAISAFVIALHLAGRQLTGHKVKVTQFMSMNRYRCMDLITPMVSTPEINEFVEHLSRSAQVDEKSRELLQQAIESLGDLSRQARKQIGTDRLLYIYLFSRKGFRRVYVGMTIALTLKILRLLRLHKPIGRQILISHMDIYPNVPIAGRPGVRLPYVKYFGLHYQILEDKTVVTMMPGLDWNKPNSVVQDSLQESLKRVLEAAG